MGNCHFADESLLLVRFAAEREEILRHKWIESEKAGRDVGFERALLAAGDWCGFCTPFPRRSRSSLAAQGFVVHLAHYFDFTANDTASAESELTMSTLFPGTPSGSL
jgi:hypothetical protein